MQVRVHEAECPKASLGRPQAPDVRQNQARRVADDDVIDLPGAMDERADLPARLARGVRERTKKLRRRQPLERDLAAVDVFEGLDRAGRESRGIPVDFRHSSWEIAPIWGLVVARLAQIR